LNFGITVQYTVSKTQTVKVRRAFFKYRIKNLKYWSRIFVLVKILYQDPHSNADSDNFYISIPKDWSGGTDNEVTVIVDDVCVIVPQTIAGATGELIVLRLLEAMIEGDVIDAGDVQKAIEHIL
jgi:hypothetical protein